MALLKKFKVADPEELEEEEGSLDQKLSGEEGDRYLIWLLLLGDRLCKHATLGCFVCGGVRPPAPLFPLGIRRRGKAYCYRAGGKCTALADDGLSNYATALLVGGAEW